MQILQLNPSEILIPKQLDLPNKALLEVYRTLVHAFTAKVPYAFVVATGTYPINRETKDAWDKRYRDNVDGWLNSGIHQTLFDWDQQLEKYQRAPYTIVQGIYPAVAATLEGVAIEAKEIKTEKDLRNIRGRIGKEKFLNFRPESIEDIMHHLYFSMRLQLPNVITLEQYGESIKPRRRSRAKMKR